MEKCSIWGSVIPGNSPRKKTEVMEIKQGGISTALTDMIRWMRVLQARTFTDGKQVIDSYTNKWVRKSDPDYGDTFEDVPYLIPFLAPGSKKAVIVVPGGGYCLKSMDNEGTDVAKRLCESGITAFVLWYRTNPYYLPYPLMDMQRAVRYVRHHAAEYGYDPEQIGAIGFSAGGAQVSLFLNILRGGLITLPAYEKDETDSVDDALNFASLVYPALGFHYNPAMLFASFPAAEVRNETLRREYMATYDVLAHLTATDIPQLVCYGSKDDMVSVPAIQSYIAALKKAGTPCREIVVEGAGHGYGAAVGTKDSFWLDEYINWLQSL